MLLAVRADLIFLRERWIRLPRQHLRNLPGSRCLTSRPPDSRSIKVLAQVWRWRRGPVLRRAVFLSSRLFALICRREKP